MSDVRSPDSGASAAAQRIFALVLRYVYLLKGSWPRILELAYWPSIQIVLPLPKALLRKSGS